MTISLRERKYAATKANLMRAVVSRLGTQSLDEVVVKDVCAEVQLSETTFFNYFPSKQDVVGYFVQIWSIETAWAMGQGLAETGSHLAAVRRMFDHTATQDQNPIGVMGEIVAYQARSRQIFTFAPLTPAEYAHHFPNKAGIDTIEAQGIDQLLVTHLVAAQQAGELNPDTDIHALTMALVAIFFVTPMMVGLGAMDDLQAVYTRQLDLLLPGP